MKCVTVRCLCSDGVRQSGLYVAISCIWERLKDQQEVDIFEAVRALRYHRPQIIQDVVSRLPLFYSIMLIMVLTF